MECEVRPEIISSGNHDLTKLTNAFMFTEEQITKQLVDMREQTDFMKKFRCALGIALREIKTLRTTASIEQSKTDEKLVETRKRHASCNLPSSSTETKLAGTSLYPSSVYGMPSAASDHNDSCECAEFGKTDLEVLREYLTKMTLRDDGDINSKLQNTEMKSGLSKNIGKLQQDPGNLIENSIRHIERLKQHVTNKNAVVARLCQQLTQARMIRVKREQKLEQKLKETTEWKEKYEKTKKLHSKQIKVTKGLRLALNVEKQKVKSSEHVAQGLEETRRAFNSLKAQAGQLMALLRDKEYEIAELTSKLDELETRNGSYPRTQDPMTSQGVMASQIHGVAAATSSGIDAAAQTEISRCTDCRKDIEAWEEKYERLYVDFEDYRRAYRLGEVPHQPPPQNPSTNSRGSLQNHPYGRRRMHAPYTSQDSYRRVSRPPLRRRVSQEEYSGNRRQNRGPPVFTPAYGPHPRPPDILLSPIEEVENSAGRLKVNSDLTDEGWSTVYPSDSMNSTYVPNVIDSANSAPRDENSHDYPRNHVSMSHEVHHENNSSTFKEFATSTSIVNHEFQPPYEALSAVLREQTNPLNTSPKHDSGISSMHSHGQYSPHHKKDGSSTPPTEPIKSKSPHDSPAHKTAKQHGVKTSYLEFGTSATPSPSNSANGQEDHQQQPLCLNSFIRYNESEDTASEQSSLPLDDLDFQDETNSVASDATAPEPDEMTFGVVWHPTMLAPEATPQDNAPVPHKGLFEMNNFSRTIAPNPLLHASDVTERNDVTTRKVKKSGRHSRCVTYKGHKIDVTEFSIHAFRDIIWSLDGGPESADDFIKFLASLAKKLNASPKWAGKHSMGNPKDWVALRGLY